MRVELLSRAEMNFYFYDCCGAERVMGHNPSC